MAYNLIDCVMNNILRKVIENHPPKGVINLNFLCKKFFWKLFSKLY